jgi:hypothetical protein
LRNVESGLPILRGVAVLLVWAVTGIEKLLCETSMVRKEREPVTRCQRAVMMSEELNIAASKSEARCQRNAI